MKFLFIYVFILSTQYSILIHEKLERFVLRPGKKHAYTLDGAHTHTHKSIMFCICQKAYVLGGF